MKVKKIKKTETFKWLNRNEDQKSCLSKNWTTTKLMKRDEKGLKADEWSKEHFWKPWTFMNVHEPSWTFKKATNEGAVLYL
jgi:hypothetical protein